MCGDAGARIFSCEAKVLLCFPQEGCDLSWLRSHTETI